MSKFEIKRQYQYNVIESYVKSHKILKYTTLAKKLSCSRQTAKKLLKSYENNCLLSTPHKHCGIKRKNYETINKIIEHYKKYLNKILEINPKSGRLNFSIYYDYAFPELGIDLSRRAVHNYLIEANIYSNKSYRSTKKKIRKAIKNKNVPKDIVQLINKIENLENIKPFKGKDGIIPGTIVELDACCDFWFSKEKYHLYMAVDSALGTPLAWHIEKEETTKGYFILLKEVIKKYGKPALIKTDKRRSFWGSENTQTLIGEVLSKLDIRLECSSDATFKPNVERSFDTWQEMLIPLFAMNNIDSLEKAKNSLDFYMNEYIKRNKKKFDIEESSFIPASPNEIELLNPTTKVKIQESLCIVFGGKTYGLFNDKNERVLLKPRGYICMTHNTENDKYFTIFENRKYYINEISRKDIWEPYSEMRKREIENFRKEKEKIINRTKYINLNLEKKKVFLDNWESKLKSKEKWLNSLLESIEK